jgi:hypothetical protein
MNVIPAVKVVDDPPLEHMGHLARTVVMDARLLIIVVVVAVVVVVY